MNKRKLKTAEKNQEFTAQLNIKNGTRRRGKGVKRKERRGRRETASRGGFCVVGGSYRSRSGGNEQSDWLDRHTAVTQSGATRNYKTGVVAL